MKQQFVVKKSDLLMRLESVQPGLATGKGGVIEQSLCFVFKHGRVITFNGEIAVRAHSGLPETVHGAVMAAPLLAMLKELNGDDLTVRFTGVETVLLGKGEGSKIKMYSQTALPTDQVEWPKKSAWKDLPKGFNDAVSITMECAGKDQSLFATTCVHFTPKYMEAYDNFQLTRYRILTPIKQNILIRRESVKHIPSLDMQEVAECRDWIHFRNQAGIHLAVKRFHEEKFPDMSHFMAAKGKPIVLPKTLGSLAKKAENFSREAEDDAVIVSLRRDRVKVLGIGETGRYWGKRKVKYDGRGLAFLIAPKLLAEITKRHNEARISKDYLRVDGSRWTYVACLGDPREAEREREEAAAATALAASYGEEELEEDASED